MASERSDRPFFSPKKVPSEVAASTRACAKACAMLLGCNETYEVGQQFVLWHKALKEVCSKGTVIRSFDSADDLNGLPQETLNRLYVATVNTKKDSADHVMVLWKEEDHLGTKKFELFDPGSCQVKRTTTVDISHERTTGLWNGICAAFVPGTDLPEKEAELVEVLSSDTDEEWNSTPASSSGNLKTSDDLDNHKKASSDSKQGQEPSEESSTSVSRSDIKSLWLKLGGKSSCKDEEKFCGHLRKYISEKGHFLTRSDFNKIQALLDEFKGFMEDLAKAKSKNQKEDVLLYESFIASIIEECENDLPRKKEAEHGS